MEKYLYQDLDKLERIHWWHISKRKTCLSLIKKYCTFTNKAHILDLGCGTGQNLKELAKLGNSQGLDNSPEAIKYSRKKGLKVTLGQADKTGFSSDHFNLITMFDVLEHVDEEKTLNEARRILAKNGCLLITVPAYSWLWSKWDNVLHHKRRYTKKKLQEVLKNNNFEIIKISYLYSFLVLPVIVIRFLKSKLSKQNYSSDFIVHPNIINYTLIKICDIERLIFMNLFSLPFGTSIVCLARKTQ